MSTYDTSSDDTAFGSTIARDRRRAVLGQVMGCVAVTVGFTALGAYLGRDLSGGDRHRALHRRVRLHLRPQRRRRERPRAARHRPAVRARTAARPGGRAASSPTTPTPTRPRCGRRPAPPRRSSRRCGAYGYATRRDLSSWARTLFWALLGADRLRDRRDLRLDPRRQRHLRRPRPRDLRRATRSSTSTACAARTRTAPCRSPPSIFLDIFNIFLFLLDLFGGSR